MWVILVFTPAREVLENSSKQKYKTFAGMKR